MAKLKKWLGDALFVVLMAVIAVIALVILAPLYWALIFISMAFFGARIVVSVIAAGALASAISYGGYLWRCGEMSAGDVRLLLIVLVAVAGVGVWDFAAWALWRWKPEWLNAILPDDDYPPKLIWPKKIETWIDKYGQKIDTILTVIMVVVLLIAIVGGPFIYGIKAFAIVLALALMLSGFFVACALAWPIVVLVGWLPRCWKRKFDEFFCAATRNCEVVLFGEVLKGDRKSEDTADEGADAE